MTSPFDVLSPHVREEMKDLEKKLDYSSKQQAVQLELDFQGRVSTENLLLTLRELEEEFLEEVEKETYQDLLIQKIKNITEDIAEQDSLLNFALKRQEEFKRKHEEEQIERDEIRKRYETREIENFNDLFNSVVDKIPTERMKALLGSSKNSCNETKIVYDRDALKNALLAGIPCEEITPSDWNERRTTEHTFDQNNTSDVILPEVTTNDSSVTHDSVNSPQHYKTAAGIESIDVIEAFDLGFNLGNAVKYILRAEHKHETPIEDYQKSLWYICREAKRRGYSEKLKDFLEKQLKALEDDK